jgi:hypothetical protein
METERQDNRERQANKEINKKKYREKIEGRETESKECRKTTRFTERQQGYEGRRERETKAEEQG